MTKQLSIALIAGWSAVAAAGTPIDRRIDADPNGRLQVDIERAYPR